MQTKLGKKNRDREKSGIDTSRMKLLEEQKQSESENLTDNLEDINLPKNSLKM